MIGFKDFAGLSVAAATGPADTRRTNAQKHGRMILLDGNPINPSVFNCGDSFLPTSPHMSGELQREDESEEIQAHYTYFFSTCKVILLSGYCILSSVQARS